MIGLLAAIVVAVLLIQAAVFSTTIYLHRAAAHKALTLHPAVSLAFRATLWITTGLSTREWVAVHRKHHAFTDREGDPHSPLLEGFWAVQLGNVFYYVREARKAEVIEKYAQDIDNDRWERWLFSRGWVGPAAGTAALCAVMGVTWGLLAAGLHAVIYVFVLSPSINALCHRVGYRNFDNTATNLRVLALLTGGEGLHNNHHGVPRSAKFSFTPSEFDPAWPIIRALTALRLARPSSVTRSARERQLVFADAAASAEQA